jgi:hypothetical protein
MLRIEQGRPHETHPALACPILESVIRMITLRRLLVSALLVLVATPTYASTSDAPDYSHLSGYAFVFGRDTSQVAVLDVDSLSVADTVDIGLTPTQAVVSSAYKRLIAIDGAQRKIAVYDLRGRRALEATLDFAPSSIVASADGRRIAAIAPDTGDVALIDAASLETKGRLRLGAIGDAMFDGAWERLHVALHGVEGVQTFDARDGSPMPAYIAPSEARYSALSRSATGRTIFARIAQSGDVDVIDAVRGSVSERKRLQGGRIYPTGGGRYLLSLDEAAGRLAIENAEGSSVVTTVSWKAREIYSAWFDTVAVASSPDSPELLVFDLDARRGSDRLRLPAPPGRGAVTSDGARIFLPVPDSDAVAAVDARRRSIQKFIVTQKRPFLVLIAGGYGICH